jgi:polar amino acid transport system substrate-binding protein
MTMKNLALIFASASLVSLSVNAATISIRADEWFPMNGEPGAAKPGFMIELAERVFGDAGHTVDYKLMPWERALDSVRKGDFDCVVGAYKDDAPDFVFPEEHWGLDNTAFYVKEGSDWTFNGYDSLLTQKVAVINGYAYGEEFDQLVKDNPQVFQGIGGNDALEKNIKKLEAGRVDVLVESPSVLAAKMKDMGVTGFKRAGDMGEPSKMYIACSPAKESSKDYVKLVDEGTAKLRESGELEKIMANYGMTDWK